MTVHFFSSFFLQLKSIVFEMSPFIITGLLLAGILKALIPEGKIGKLLGSKSPAVPLIASLAGVPMPLCSCSVLPFSLSLRKEGASKGAVVSFLTSAPQTGVDSILVSYSFFGLPFALFKLAVSFISGAVSGWLINGVDQEEEAEEAEAAEEAEEAACSGDSCSCSGSGTSCGCGEEECETERTAGIPKRIVTYAFDELLGDFAVMLLLGVLISALISTLVPPGAVGGFRHEWIYYPAVLLLSIPLYVCATASVPIAFALLHAGLPPGAAMVFLIAGPATNIATIGIVGKILGRKAGAVYVLMIILFALAGGFLFDSLLGGTAGAGAGGSGQFEMPPAVQMTFSVILAGLVFFHVIKRIKRKVNGHI